MPENTPQPAPGMGLLMSMQNSSSHRDSSDDKEMKNSMMTLSAENMSD
jgi:hypothetical protein